MHNNASQGIAAAIEAPIPAFTVADLRTELGLTLAEMGERVGLSKSQMHEVERRNSATVRVAIALEEMSGRRLDAGDLCEDVRLARHGLPDTSEMDVSSQGNATDCFPSSSPAPLLRSNAMAGVANPGGADHAAGASALDHAPDRAPDQVEAAE